jgi:hypothetical protein
MNAQALEDLRGVDYLQAWYRWWFSREVPDRGAFKIKTGAQVMFVKNDLSMDKNYFNGKWES